MNRSHPAPPEPLLRLLHRLPGQGSVAETQAWLEAFSPRFAPVLSELRALPAYAFKLHRHAHRLVYRTNQTPIAFAACYTNDLDRHEAFLPLIAVAADHEGEGWGQHLLEKVMLLALEAGMTALRLEVETSNHRARSLYARCGFTPLPKSADKSHGARQLLVRPLLESC